MDLSDDLVTAGVGVVGAVIGSLVGAWKTRQASLDEFRRVSDRNEIGWRRALHYECYENIKLYENKPGTETFWSFETSVLDECVRWSSAFSNEVLERIVRVRTANGHLNALLSKFRPLYLNNMIPQGPLAQLEDLRKQVIGEVREIFNAIPVSTPN